MSRARRPLLALSLAIAAVLIMLGITRPLPAADPHFHRVVSADTLKWGPPPPSLPPGALASPLVANAAKAGPFVLRLKLPASYVIPPHWLSRDVSLTVLSGAFAVAAGERLDRSTPVLRAGSFAHLPAGISHFAFTTEETVVQVSGSGPFELIYLDPKDDPRKK